MSRRGDIGDLLERFDRGEVAAAARLISVLEDGGEGAERVLDAIFNRTGGAWRVGFTGPPGAGKSSLLHRITGRMRDRGHRIGIIAVAPTSPFTGGALLGDRIRMQALSADPEVFVRSLASRGSLGGISNCTDDAADLLDAFGKDLVLIETVGVGQSELEIAENILRERRELTVDNDALAVNVIHHVGVGGEFLSHEHTLAQYAEALWMPECADRTPPDTLETERTRDMVDAATEKVRSIWQRDDLYRIDDDRAKAIDKPVERAEALL